MESPSFVTFVTETFSSYSTSYDHWNYCFDESFHRIRFVNRNCFIDIAYRNSIQILTINNFKINSKIHKEIGLDDHFKYSSISHNVVRLP